MIRLYDSRQRQKVDFSPQHDGQVSIYVCGPTVYDYCHAGHARCYVSFDVIVRYLKSTGLVTRYVRNVTDIDDKIFQRARERGEDPRRLAQVFAQAFEEDMQQLGLLTPDVQPRVTQNIPPIIELVEALVAKGHAYAVGGDVYFDVDSFPAYGDLSGRNLEDLRAGARVEVDERKKNPLDFALWKAAKPDEIAWPSPWGPGRPGWHIECSAMSHSCLGETFDLHGGGMDLIFPHHENEMAQSRACFGANAFARYWLHNGFVNVRSSSGDSEKMSKSLGNFFTLRQIFAQNEPEALRWFLLNSHYRKPVTFDVEPGADGTPRFPGLEESEKRLSYAYCTLERLRTALAQGKPATSGEVLEPAKSFADRVHASMSDDFNSAAVMGHVADILTLANQLLDQPGLTDKHSRRQTLEAIARGIELAQNCLGLMVAEPDAFFSRRREKLCRRMGVDAAFVEGKLSARNEARKNRDFGTADAIRKELMDRSIEVMDGPQGSTWRVQED